MKVKILPFCKGYINDGTAEKVFNSVGLGISKILRRCIHVNEIQIRLQKFEMDFYHDNLVVDIWLNMRVCGI